jgi:hypothetical protein
LGRHIAIYCYRKLNMLPDLRATFTQTKVWFVEIYCYENDQKPEKTGFKESDNIT